MSALIKRENYLEIVDIIKAARERAFRKINEELILTYQKVGQYISEKCKPHHTAILIFKD